MNKLFLVSIILTAVLEKLVFAQQTLISNKTLYSPPNIYQYQPTSNFNITGTLYWLDSTCNLDVFVYEENDNLLNDNQTLRKFQSNNSIRQSINFAALRYKIYYFRVIQKSPTVGKLVCYSLKIFLPNDANFSGCFYSNLQASVFTIDNQIPLYRIKYVLQSQIDVFVSVFGTSITQETSLSNNSKVCLSYQNEYQKWIIVLLDSTRNAYELVPISVSIYNQSNVEQECKKCKVNYTYSQQTKRCEERIVFKLSSTIIIILSVTMIVIIVIISIAVAWCFYKKCRKLERQQQQQIKYKANYMQSTVQVLQNTNNDAKESALCSICLDTNCDLLLKCGHKFHVRCIQQWSKRNKICPLCRLDIAIS